jgi:hypothetical protein
MPVRNLVSAIATTLYNRPTPMRFPVLAAQAALQEHAASLTDPLPSRKGVGRDYTHF